MAVTAIVTEMTSLNNFIHSYTKKQVAAKLGKFPFFISKTINSV
jgi:hypothetical protein